MVIIRRELPRTLDAGLSFSPCRKGRTRILLSVSPRPLSARLHRSLVGYFS